MMIQPKIRGFICTSAHPVGCQRVVNSQIAIAKSEASLPLPKNVLVIGASTGYGLASRIAATFAGQANTIGVSFEKPADEKRTASPGWYNTAAFEMAAHDAGYYAKSINGDAFSNEIKEKVIQLIKSDLGQIDLLIYSLASPRRTDPTQGITYQSALKPINQTFHGKSIDVFKGEMKDVIIEPATSEEIESTIRVMGGDDWALWINALMAENLLAPQFKTVAYSYIGPHVTYPIYKEGTIGKAKDHLKQTADQLTKQLATINGEAIVSVNKAVVTQASAAIPVVPLYIALLFNVMKNKKTHEDCIEQMIRLFKHYLYSTDPQSRDAEGFIRLDDLEMDADTQATVMANWEKVNNDNLMTLTDLAGYREAFYHLFGFEVDGVDYEASVDANVAIPSITEGVD